MTGPAATAGRHARTRAHADTRTAAAGGCFPDSPDLSRCPSPRSPDLSRCLSPRSPDLSRCPSPGSPDLDSRRDWRASVGYSVSGTRWLPSPCSMQRPFRVYHRLSESPIRVAYPSCLSESRIRNTMTADSWRQLRFLASKNPSRCVARRPPPARLLIFTAASACHGASVCAAAWRVRLRPAHSSASTSP